MLGSN
jgi:hypothetical protein